MFALQTAGGNELRLRKFRSSSSLDLFLDRGVIGGDCKAGSTIDVKALDALAAKSKSIARKTWRLADCGMARGEGERFIVDYHAGFVPGALIVRGTMGPNAEEVSYVVSSFEQEGAAGTFYTTLGGEGVYAYSAAGRKVRPLEKLVIAYGNHTGTYRIETGEAILDDELRKCTITNLWHVEKLLSK